MDPNMNSQIRGSSVKCLCNIITQYLSEDQLLRKLQTLLLKMIATTGYYSENEDSTVLQVKLIFPFGINIFKS